MKISIARALKERARLAGKIAEVFELISEENSMVEGAVRSADIEKKFEEYKTLLQKMVMLKGKIGRANAGIAVELADLAETKSMLVQLKKLPVKEGLQRAEYGMESSYNLTVIINKNRLSTELEALQQKANNLQDKIDEFNASTFIEVEL